MSNKTHSEQIERWGRFVRENPDSWKKEHTQFIDAQIKKSWRVYKKLGRTPEGKAKIRKLREI